MSDPITRENERNRQRARDTGQGTYRHNIVETWSGCVECGNPIRHRGDRSIYRGCGCPGVRWQCHHDGWRRLED